MVDIIGPRERPSLHYVGRRGNHSGGGARYVVLFIDVGTERIFHYFVKTKDEVEATVRTAVADMEIAAQDSVDHSASTPIKVQRFISDRDSNMTSTRAVTDMLERRIEHEMAATDGINQTPLLDAVARHLLDRTRAMLVQAGLPLEFWGFAFSMAVTIVNHLPTRQHPLRHSAMRRWNGRSHAGFAQSIRTFGCEAYPHQPQAKRENKAKLDPTSNGGDGRWRYVGPGKFSGPGLTEKGHLLLDTKVGRLHTKVGVIFDEDMDRVRKLPNPVGRWDLQRSMGLEPLRSEREIDELIVNVDEDAVRRVEAGGADPNADSGGDSDGSGVDDGGGGHDVAQPEAPHSAKAKAKTAKGKKSWWASLPKDTLIHYNQVNPKSGASFHKYEKYKHAKTIKEFYELGGKGADLTNDGKKGYFYVQETAAPATAPWLPPVAAVSRSHNAYAAEQRRQGRLAVYAAHQVQFFQSRPAPAEGPQALRLLPYWDAAVKFGDGLKQELNLIQGLANEYAMWQQQLDGAPAAQRAEVKAHQTTVTALAQTVCKRAVKAFYANVVRELGHVRASEVPTPTRFKDITGNEFEVHWIAACKKELKNLQKYNVYTWVKRPPGVHLITGTWAFKCKSLDDGSIDKFKARICSQGFREVYGVHFLEVSAPVGKLKTFRQMMAEAARRGMQVSLRDISSAYLTAPLDVDIYMEPPEGTREIDGDSGHHGEVWKLNRALYGLRQSGRVFHLRFRKQLLHKFGFKASAADNCLFIKRRGKSKLQLLVFVDDICITNDATADGRALRQEFEQNIADEGYEFSPCDDDHVYLGVAINRVNDTVISLSQERYITDVMIKYGFMSKDLQMLKKPTRSPSPSGKGKVLIEDCPQKDPSENKLGRRYREYCGVLRWLEVATRVDISATLSELCKVQINPSKGHMERLEWLMRYVCTTRKSCIVYGGPNDRDAPEGPLIMYSDSDWAGDPETRHSRGGYIAMSWGGLVSWESRKIKSVCLSSCEAEFVAAKECVCEAVWLTQLLHDMGYVDLQPRSFGKLCGKDYIMEQLSRRFDESEMPYMLRDVPRSPPVLCAVDNKCAIATSRNGGFHRRMKHIDIAYLYVQQEVNKDHVRLKYIDTKNNLADLMTKALKRVTFNFLVTRLLCEMKDKVLCRFDNGKPIDLQPRPAALDELYTQPTPGLDMGDTLTPWRAKVDVSGDAAPRRKEGPAFVGAPLRKGLPPTVHGSGRTQRAAAGMAALIAEQLRRRIALRSAVRLSASVASIGQQMAVLKREGAASLVADCLSRRLVVALQARLSALSAKRERQIAAMKRAIVDSGASSNFCGKLLELDNAVPDNAVCGTADEEPHKVVEIGDCSPLTEIRRVNSFGRPLVSASYLVGKFGEVKFDRRGVHLVTKQSDGRVWSTQIGKLTDNKLYSCDLRALSRHASVIGRARPMGALAQHSRCASPICNRVRHSRSVHGGALMVG